MSRTKCLILLVITATLWSMAGVIIKSVTWSAPAIASFRSLGAALTIAFLARKTLDYRRPDRGQWLTAILLALVSITFVWANKLTTAANAILLQYTAPVWVALAAPLILRERTSGRDWLFILVALGGMGLFFKDALSPEGLGGILLAIMSGLIFAGLALSLRWNRGRGGQPLKSMVLGNLLLAGLGLFCWRPPWPSPGEFGLLIIAGAFQFGLPYYLYALASAGVSSLELVLVTALEPIMNPIWVFLVVGERPGGWSIIGGAVVLATITVWSLLKTLNRNSLTSDIN
ncbi:MAG: DMT family transporter [Candidatus Adiutrix sp.]|jgi:drug/metabolite transporter (DMT)-like permease|nr:DMT family transporter [Candidatus Adiutrix sp.]